MLQEITRGYRDLQEITRGLRSCKGLHGVAWGYMGLQGLTRDYSCLLLVTKSYWGYKKLKVVPKVTKGYIELLRVTRVYKEVKSFCLFDYRGVTRGYRIFRTKKLTRFLSRKPYRHSDAKS